MKGLERYLFREVGRGPEGKREEPEKGEGGRKRRKGRQGPGSPRLGILGREVPALWRDAEEGAPPSGGAAPEPCRSGLKAPPQPHAQTGAGFLFVPRLLRSGCGARAESLRGRTMPAMGAG